MCLVVPRDSVNKIRIWPLKRDDHSGILIGVGGTWRSDWPACVFANDVSTRIDRSSVCKERSIARVQGQVAAICYTPLLLRVVNLSFGSGNGDICGSEHCIRIA